jgi:hypothetical protein
MPIAKSTRFATASLTAEKCSATLPMNGTTIRPMNSRGTPQASIVGWIEYTSTSDTTPVARAVAPSSTIACVRVQCIWPDSSVNLRPGAVNEK